MRDRNLRRSLVAKHRNNLKSSDVALIHAQPYSAGLWQRQLEREKIEEMLKAGIPKSTTIELLCPMDFVPKKGESLRFCVNYNRVNAVAATDNYTIS